MDAKGPNAEQIEYWNDRAGRSWVECKESIDVLIEPLGRSAIERLAPAPGESLLDVGCGTGQTSLELARCVGVEGSVLAVDISSPMLRQARADAQAAGLKKLHFENADAQTYAFAPASVAGIFSRFGVMFFAEPGAAFANLRVALAPGGRIVFLCWQAAERNPWVTEIMAAVLRHVEAPPTPAPGGPGPFSLADAEALHTILGKAGYATIRIDPLEQKLDLGAGGDLDRAVEQMMRSGPASRLLADAAPELRVEVAASLRETLLPHSGPDGVWMDSAAWLVSANAA